MRLYVNRDSQSTFMRHSKGVHLRARAEWLYCIRPLPFPEWWVCAISGEYRAQNATRYMGPSEAFSQPPKPASSCWRRPLSDALAVCSPRQPTRALCSATWPHCELVHRNPDQFILSAAPRQCPAMPIKITLKCAIGIDQLGMYTHAPYTIRNRPGLGAPAQHSTVSRVSWRKCDGKGRCVCILLSKRLRAP